MPSTTAPAPTTSDATAVVFPGQGSQRPGMARPWLEHAAGVRWSEADAVLGRDITRLGVDADADELREPASCQVALFVHQVVLYDAWCAGGHQPQLVAGHSLGEYNALYAAGVLPFADALRLVAARARATQEAAAAAPGGMAACLGCDSDDVVDACRHSGAHVANDNAPGQMVVAGTFAALDALAARLAPRRGRVTRLEVGAPYHSPHMQPAVAGLDAALGAVVLGDAAVPVVANVDGVAHGANTDWRDLLRRQLVAPVRWRESLETIVRAGVGTLVELGASPVLTGLAKRTAPTLQRRFLAAPADLGVAA